MSIYERIHATAVAGGTVRGEVAQCVARRMAGLGKAHAQVLAFIDEAHKRRTDLSAAPTALPDIQPPLQALVVAGQQQIQVCQEDLRTAKRHVRAFQNLHGLMRAPTTPPVLLNVLLLGLMVFVEAFANAAFFQNAAMTATPMAALLTSILISSTNILACACAGFFIGRWLDYGLHAIDPQALELVKPRRRAHMLRWVFIAVIGFVHVTIGLVRAQENLTEVEHTLGAYTAMLTTPESILLVLTGGCLSVLAWHKGRTAFSDPYPHYAAFQEAVEAAQDALETAIEHTSAEIEAHADEAIAQHEQTYAQHSQAVQAYNQKVEQAHEAHRALQQHIEIARQTLATDIAHIQDSYHGAGGAQDIDLSPEQQQAFADLLRLDMPQYWPNAAPAPTQTPIHTAKAEALAALLSPQKETSYETP